MIPITGLFLSIVCLFHGNPLLLREESKRADDE